MIRIALDSNILAYLAGVSRAPADDGKIVKVRALIRRLTPKASLIAPVQALGELFVVLRRSGTPADEARAILMEFAGAFGAASSETPTVLAAADLVVDHKLQFWDALIVAAAVRSGATRVVSEDLTPGQIISGVPVVNPFTE